MYRRRRRRNYRVLLFPLIGILVAIIAITVVAWPRPAPTIHISSVSPRPANAASVFLTDPFELYWEVLYSGPADQLRAEFYIGGSRDDLTMVAESVSGRREAEGIVSFTYEAEVEPHSEYWWMVKVISDNGKTDEGGPWRFSMRNHPPTRPEVIYPSNNAVDIPVRDLVFSWEESFDPDGDPVTYDVYIGLTPRLTADNLVASGLSGTSLRVDELRVFEFSTRYYWRVEARDSFGGESFSTTAGFLTEPVPARATPVNPEPSHGNYNVNPDSVTLEWSISPERYYWPLEYEVFFARRGENPVSIGKTEEMSIEIGTLSSHSDYSWYVVATDTERGRTARSETWEFETTTRPPVVELLSPQDGAYGVSRDVVVSWRGYDPDGTTVTYNVFVARNDDDPSPVLSESRLESVTLEELESAARYTLTIVATDEHGGETILEASFVVDNRPPVVNLISPENEEELFPAEVLISWEAYDPDGDDISFELLIIDDDGEEMFFETQETEVRLYDLFPGKSYSWRVRAIDSKEAETWSDERVFYTVNTPPDIPVAVAPEPGATGVTVDNTLLLWSCSDPDGDPLVYEVRIGTDPDLEDPETFSTERTRLELQERLETNRQYYWQVIADDGKDQTAGPVWSFRTLNLPPERPELLRPSHRSEGVDTEDVVLEWSVYDPDDDEIEVLLYISEAGRDALEIPMGMGMGRMQYTLESLNPFTEYTWWVTVEDSLGKINESTRGTFRTGNLPPQVRLLSPDKLSMIALTSPVRFVWEARDPEGEPVFVELLLGESDRVEDMRVITSGEDIDSFTYREDLAPGVDYYVYIRATDPHGAVGSIEEPVLMRARTGALTYSRPLDGANLDAERTFTWNYRGAQDDPEFVFNLFDQEGNLLDSHDAGTSTSFVYPEELPGNRTYNWSISAVGERVEQGPVFSFRTPDTPTRLFNPAPSNNMTNVPVTDVVLSWSYEDPDSDNIRFDVYLNNMNTPLFRNLEDSRVTLDQRLSGNTVYTWQVVARDEHGNISRSPVWRFTTRNHPPTIRLLSPANNATGITGVITLRWQGEDLDNDPLTYEVFFGTRDNLEKIETTTQTSLSIRTYGANTQYFWRVTVSDGRDTVTSETRSLTTGEIPLVAPEIRFPTDEERNVRLVPELQWTRGDSAGYPVTYRVYMGTSRDNLQLVLETGGTSARIPGILQSNTQYFWRVVADSGDAGAVESPVASFRTQQVVDTFTYVINRNVSLAYFTDARTTPTITTVATGINAVLPPIMSDDKLYIIDRSGVLRTYELAPRGVTMLAEQNTNSFAEELLLIDGFLWILDSRGTGRVLRVPLSPEGIPGTPVSVFSGLISPSDMAFDDNMSTMFIADALSGLKILERTDAGTYRSSMDEIAGLASLDGFTRAVEYVGGFAFIGESGAQGGLYSLNLSTMSKREIGRYFICNDIAVSASTVYALTDRGLSIIDISVPGAPVVIRDMTDIPGIDSGSRIIAGDRVLALINVEDILFFNITNRNDPMRIR